MERALPEQLAMQPVAIDKEDNWLRSIDIQDFETADNWLLGMQQRSIIEWYHKDIAKLLGIDPVPCISFATEEQPVFNRNFSLLIQNLLI